MIWQIEWAGELVFGYDFGGIAADALEMFTETLQIVVPQCNCAEWGCTGNCPVHSAWARETQTAGSWAEWMPAEYGHSCDGCGRYTLTHVEQCNEDTLTDRGIEWRLMDYELCDECRHEIRN